MSLQKQVISYPLGVGLDTKTDEAQVQFGKLVLMENGVFTKIGRAALRNGLSSIGQNISGGGVIESPKELSVFKGELNVTDGTRFYSYSSSTTTWIDKGPVAGASASSAQIIRNTFTQANPDAAYSQGIAVFAWEDTSGGIRATVISTDSNQPLIANVLISATGTRPKVSAQGVYFYVHYCELASTEIRVRRFNASAITSGFSTAAVVVNDTHATLPYLDISPVGVGFAFLYRTVAGMRLGYLKTDGTLASALDGYANPIAIAQDPASCLTVLGYFENDLTNDGIYVFWHNPSGLQCLIYNIALSNTPSVVVIDPFAGILRNIAVCNKTASSVSVFYEIDAIVPDNTYIATGSISRAGTVTDLHIFLRSVGIASKPFVIDSVVYILVTHSSALQCTYYTVGESGLIANRISYQQGGGLSGKVSSVPQACVLSSTEVLIPTQVKGRLVSSGTTVFGVVGLQATRLNFSDESLFTSSELGSNLHLAAGMLYGYDGINLNELGFNLFPENVSVIDGGAGAITAGTRSYKLLYEWTDQQGQIHRSAPSVAFSYTSGAGRQASIYFETLRLTQKENVTLVVYRTVDAGTTYYRVSSITSPTLNNKAVDAITVIDNQPDSAITGNELLYTTGRVIENIAPPSCTALSTYNNRLILVGLEDQNAFWYSKVSELGVGVEFTDSFTGRIDQGEGGIQCAAQMDDKLILFKASSMYALAGQGPEATGFNNDFQVPQLIATDVGCAEPKSVVKTPLGLMFKSAKGYYLLSRSLQVSYKGAQVEDYNSLQVSSAELIESKNQVRFTHSDGNAVVYDYYFDQWSVFTNYTCSSAVTWQGNYVMARASGEINKEVPDTYLDNNVPVTWKIVTGWLSLAQLSGFQRIYRCIFLGINMSEHLFRVRIGYNLENDYREDLLINSTSVLGDNTWGSDTNWGSAEVWGGTPESVWQFMVKPMVQKCSAIRFELTSLNPANVNGSGFEIRNMLVQFGVKGGLNRLPKSKVMQVTS